MTPAFTRFKIGSSALGEREDVHVHIYPTLDAMRAAGTTFNGSDLAEALAVTQVWTDDDRRTNRRAHLNHYNEPFAHLYSDLLHGAVAKLYKLGAYA